MQEREWEIEGNEWSIGCFRDRALIRGKEEEWRFSAWMGLDVYPEFQEEDEGKLVQIRWW